MKTFIINLHLYQTLLIIERKINVKLIKRSKQLKRLRFEQWIIHISQLYQNKAIDKNKQNFLKNKISYITSQSSLDKLNAESKDLSKPEVAFSKHSLVTIVTNDSRIDNIRSVFGKLYVPINKKSFLISLL